MPPISRRTIIITVVCVLLAAVIVVPAATEDEQAAKPPDRPPVTQRDDGETVTAILPRDKVVRARVGQFVELEVTASRPDSVAIAGLGLSEAVSPGAPTTLEFIAASPGTYRVTLELADRRIGKVVVTARD